MTEPEPTTEAEGDALHSADMMDATLLSADVFASSEWREWLRDKLEVWGLRLREWDDVAAAQGDSQ